MPDKIPLGGMEKEGLTTTVLTCEGDITDPAFPYKLKHLVTKLQNLISDEQPIQVTKVEPWNSVRVTFNIPQEAAQRLRLLAERGDSVLRELGILSVQIEGDQVIALTLANQFNEPQEIVLRKTSESQDGTASMSFSLPNSEPVPGPSSTEPAHKNITQFLGHLVGGAQAASSSVVNSTDLLDITKTDPAVKFISPNVIAPSNTEPIPFPSAHAASPSAAFRATSSVKPQNYGPFPFASMTHAMNTKHSGLSQVAGNTGNTHLLLTTATLHNSLTNSSITSISPSRAQTAVVATTSLHKASASHSVFNNIVSRISPSNSVVQVSRANVALSSPLLVNLLQSETSNIQGHNKLMPPPNLVINQGPKRKRKSRKGKEKGSEEVMDSTSKASSALSSSPIDNKVNPPSSSSQAFSIPLSSLTQSPSSASTAFHQIAKAKSSVQIQSTNIHPQAQGQPPVSIHVQLQGQPPVSKRHPIHGPRAISTIRQPTVPNIHPQAQGQPQVHTGNLPLHSHIPVGTPQLARPPVTSVYSSTHGLPMNTSRIMVSSRDHYNRDIHDSKLTRSNIDIKSEKKSTSPDMNPFPSPPSFGDGKTKHLINPFTGQMEPMPSDDEDEDESIGSLPPFPEFEIDTSENGQSEKSLSDSGKDNNLSSDTDSGISKSHTDISQSSTECGPAIETAKESKKQDNAPCRTESVANTPVASSVPMEKLKLRLKLDHKTIRESKDAEKKKECNPQLNQKIDVAVVNIPALKKNVALGSAPSEPRVPPLHISLRGPNSAVVVSPRKEDAKARFSANKDQVPETAVKVAPKKARSPRSSKSVDASGTLETGRILDSLDKKSKCSNKRNKEEYWNQNVKNMSGGGIVEMSEKLSTVQCYETYLTDLALGAALQKKGQNPLKSEVITLTSCATGESVSIPASGASESSLPFHVVVGADNLPPVSVTMQQTPPLAKQVLVAHADKLSKAKHHAVSSGRNHLRDVAERLGIDPRSKKDTLVASVSRRSHQLMQKSSLPHSTTATKKAVPENSPSDQVQQSSANCVPYVPPSSHVVCTVSCTTSVVTSVTDQPVVSFSSDAKRLTSTTTTSSSSSSSSSSKLPLNDSNKVPTSSKKNIQNDSVNDQSNNQCNTSSTEASIVVTCSDLVKIQNVSAFSNSLSDVLCANDNNNIDNTNEVQMKTVPIVVNTDKTANHFDTNNTPNDHADAEISNTVVVHPAPERPKVVANEPCKNAVFSTFIERCRSPIASYVSISKRDIIKEVVGASEKVRLIEVKKPPIAQIITVDSSTAVQSHVIEVPSMDMPDSLVKSDLAVEMGSIPSLIPSDGVEAFIVSRKQSVAQGSGNQHVPGTTKRLEVSSDSQDPSCSNGNGMFSGNSQLKASIKDDEDPERGSSTLPSEESSMDSIDEERKSCLQATELQNTIMEALTDVDKGLKTSCSDLSSKEVLKNISVESLLIKNEISTSDSTRTNDGSDSSHTAQKTEAKASVCSSDPVLDGIPDTKKSTADHSALEIVSLSTLSDRTDGSLNAKGMASRNLPSSPTSLCNKSTVLKVDASQASDSSTDTQSKLTCSNQPKPTTHNDQTSAVCSSSSNLAVASFVPQVRFQSPEINTGGRVRLIFKGSAPHSVLTGCNSPAGFVLPLNSTKTVPIKLVTLPGGAAGLSVRSTSNPNVVEIIGPNTTPSHAPSSGSIHRSSPVRLVVSKVSPNVTGTNSGNLTNTRSRVLVKSVVVSSTSSPIKLSPAKSDISSALPISTTSSVIVSHSASSTVMPTTVTVKSMNSLESTSSLPKQPSVKSSANEENTETSSLPKPETRNNAPSVLQLEIEPVAFSTPKIPDASNSQSVPSTSSSVLLIENKSKSRLSSEQSQPCSNQTESSNVIEKEPITAEVTTVKVEEKELVVQDKVDATEKKQGSTEEVKNELPTSIQKKPCKDTKRVETGAIVGEETIKDEKPKANSTGHCHPVPISNKSLQVAKDVTVKSDVPVAKSKSSRKSNPTEGASTEVAIPPNTKENSIQEIAPPPPPKEEKPREVEHPIRPKAEIAEKLDGIVVDESVLKDIERSSLTVSLVCAKPVKKKCSENATQLVKVSAEDGPKKGSVILANEEPSSEKAKVEKLEEDVTRMNLRMKRPNSIRKVPGVPHSDCSSDDDLTLNELASKTRLRETTTRNRACRETPTEMVNCRPRRQRSGSNESGKSEDASLKPKERKREVKREEPVKKLPERAKRGVNKGQNVQRNPPENEVKPVAQNKPEDNSLKRKTRSTVNAAVESVADMTPVKRRRYSKDGHR